ncbi:MAG: antitoxin MazE family protein [Sinobacteraceae bacterium]|nr:antitoxin MazE family protein [Nevskiaceae bacterium]
MSIPVHERVNKRRQFLRSQGLRPVPIWVPDTRQPGFAEACRKQCQIVARADAQDTDLNAFMDAALDDAVNQGE